MKFRQKYKDRFPSLESMYQTEKDVIDEFCQQTEIYYAWEQDCLVISNAPEAWILHQSLIDGTTLLYHKNTKDIKEYNKSFYEQFDGYHLQPIQFVSIIYMLCYIYLHRLCTEQIHLPFDKLPKIMQEFIQYYQKESEMLPKELGKERRRLILKDQKKADKKTATILAEELLDSINTNSE